MIVKGYIHETTILDAFGYQWSTWERDYRTKIPGRTTPTGRWIHENALLRWFSEPSEARERDKSRASKSPVDGRIDWDHPYIKINKKAPGYLVKELHGFTETNWKKWMAENKHAIELINDQPWVRLGNDWD